MVVFGDPSAPLPEGEHHPAADGAAAADSKDTADEKMEGERSEILSGVQGTDMSVRSLTKQQYLNGWNLKSSCEILFMLT